MNESTRDCESCIHYKQCVIDGDVVLSCEKWTCNYESIYEERESNQT